MSIKYINGDEVRFTSHDEIFVDVTLSDGTTIKDLQPRLMFPVSNRIEYISFQNEEGEEAFILKSLNGLSDEQREIVTGCIKEYYRIPEIIEIVDKKDDTRIWVWKVKTDRGPTIIEMSELLDDLKTVSGNRIRMKDDKSNRYEISDVTKLNKKGYNIIFYES